MRVIICTSLLDCPGFMPGSFFARLAVARVSGRVRAALGMLQCSNFIS